MEPELFRPVILRARLSVGFALSVRATSYASELDQAHKFVTPRRNAAAPKEAVLTEIFYLMPQARERNAPLGNAVDHDRTTVRPESGN
jgi:hypothetical protein